MLRALDLDEVVPSLVGDEEAGVDADEEDDLLELAEVGGLEVEVVSGRRAPLTHGIILLEQRVLLRDLQGVEQQNIAPVAQILDRRLNRFPGNLRVLNLVCDDAACLSLALLAVLFEFLLLLLDGQGRGVDDVGGGGAWLRGLGNGPRRLPRQLRLHLSLPAFRRFWDRRALLCILFLIHLLIQSVHFQQLLEYVILFEFVVGALCGDRALVHDDNVVGLVDEVNGVRCQDSGFALQCAVDDIGHDLTPYLRVQGRNGIVHEVYVAVLVNGARQADSRLLPAAEIDAALSDLRHVAGLELVEVTLQLAVLDGVDVLRGVQGLVVENVLADHFVLDPGNLVGVG